MEVRREGEKKNHNVEVQTILTYINQVEVMCGGLRRGALL